MPSWNTLGLRLRERLRLPVSSRRSGVGRRKPRRGLIARTNVKLNIESTTKIVTLLVDGKEISARVWEGHTAAGIPVHCFITRVAVKNGLDHSQFERELQ